MRMTRTGLLVLCALAITNATCGPTRMSESKPRADVHPATAVPFTPAEIRLICRHTPLPEPADSTNRYFNSASAARLGHRLFFDPRLSANGRISCSTCHDPARGFSDGKPLSEGLRRGARHTPSLWNVAYNRWYFWDGRADSLWAQALHPIENPAEMGSSRLAVAHLIDGDASLRRDYEATFGTLTTFVDAARFPRSGKPASNADPSADTASWDRMSKADQGTINRVYANVGKAIAAYESRLLSRHSPFDRFVEGLKTGDQTKLEALSTAAQRGLKLFIGPANCRVCHMGPNFTDGEFHDTRVPPPGGGQPTDPGRFDGAQAVIHDPFNSRSTFSDDREDGKIEYLVNIPDNWGRFKTPTLRNVGRTAPYMHQGQFTSLRDVVSFYSTFDGATPAGHHAETILQPLLLATQEIDDLVAFLESLTDESIDPALLKPL